MCGLRIWPVAALSLFLKADSLWLMVSRQGLPMEASEGPVDLGAGVMEGLPLFVALFCGGTRGHVVVFCPLKSMLGLDPPPRGRAASLLTLHLQNFSWGWAQRDKSSFLVHLTVPGRGSRWWGLSGTQAEADSPILHTQLP